LHPCTSRPNAAKPSAARFRVLSRGALRAEKFKKISSKSCKKFCAKPATREKRRLKALLRDKVERNAYDKRWRLKNRKRLNEEKRERMKSPAVKARVAAAQRKYYLANRQKLITRAVTRKADLHKRSPKFRKQLSLDSKAYYILNRKRIAVKAAARYAAKSAARLKDANSA
jgi:hypothetical protein